MLARQPGRLQAEFLLSCFPRPNPPVSSLMLQHNTSCSLPFHFSYRSHRLPTFKHSLPVLPVSHPKVQQSPTAKAQATPSIEPGRPPADPLLSVSPEANPSLVPSAEAGLQLQLSLAPAHICRGSHKPSYPKPSLPRGALSQSPTPAGTQLTKGLLFPGQQVG